jgi:hypothetical protein
MPFLTALAWASRALRPALSGGDVSPPFDSVNSWGSHNSKFTNWFMVYTYNEVVTGANLNQQTSLGGLTL